MEQVASQRRSVLDLGTNREREGQGGVLVFGHFLVRMVNVLWCIRDVFMEGCYRGV